MSEYGLAKDVLEIKQQLGYIINLLSEEDIDEEEQEIKKPVKQEQKMKDEEFFQ